METFPYFLKNGGTIAVSIEDTPCIAPVSSAEQIIDIAALLPEQVYIIIAVDKPMENITAEQLTGFFILFLYKTEVICVQRMLNSGRTIPVSMDTAVSKLYVSEM